MNSGILSLSGYLQAIFEPLKTPRLANALFRQLTMFFGSLEISPLSNLISSTLTTLSLGLVFCLMNFHCSLLVGSFWKILSKTNQNILKDKNFLKWKLKLVLFSLSKNAWSWNLHKRWIEKNYKLFQLNNWWRFSQQCSNELDSKMKQKQIFSELSIKLKFSYFQFNFINCYP